MSKSFIKYSVIVCTYNRSNFLKETLNSILSVFKDRCDFEVLVIDNNSTDDTESVLDDYLNVLEIRYFFEKSQGLSFARNRGILESRGDILIYLDDDIDLPQNYFDLCDEIFNNEAIAISGGKVLPCDADIPKWLPRKYYFLVSVYDLGDKPKNVRYLMGGNFAIRKEVALKIGFYNTRLGRRGKLLMGGEEIDYQNRARDLGYKICYYPEQLIFHKIDDKLNLDYILRYAYQLGKSERIIDSEHSTVRVLSKSFKSFFAILISTFFGRRQSRNSLVTYIQIIGQYGRGFTNSHEA
jgi:glycosyltransferase involved in cell wall biosynthesis